MVPSPSTPLGVASSRSRRWRTDLSPTAKAKIVEWGKALAPQEACGIMLPPDHVIQLPNRAKVSKRTESYEVHEDDVVEAISEWLEKTPGARAFASAESGDLDLEFVVWHTHPNGFVGPSRRDIRAKRSLYPPESSGSTNVRFLVVSLPWGEATFF